jgi:mannose-6-phosphate isomerase-like protein (cupin superfamily)
LERRTLFPRRGRRQAIRTGALALLLGLFFPGCARLDSSILGHYSGDLALQNWRTIAKTNRPERGEILRIVDAGRSDTLSNHIVVVRSRELPHRHVLHDSTVILLEGRGTMVIGKERKRVRPGAVFFIPRGTVHHFTNGAKNPSVALVVFSPPFDGKDREIVRPPPVLPEISPPVADSEPGAPAPGVSETAAAPEEGVPAPEESAPVPGESARMEEGPPPAVSPEAPPQADPGEAPVPGEPSEQAGPPLRPRPSPGAVIVIEEGRAPEPRVEGPGPPVLREVPPGPPAEEPAPSGYWPALPADDPQSHEDAP